MGSIGERLIQIRGQLSQAQFANAVGVHKNTLGGYERGERTPDAAFLKALMDAGFNANWLLSGSGPMLLANADTMQSPSSERMDRIERLLESLGDAVPVRPDALNKSRELIQAKQQLIEISIGQHSTGEDRARADKILRLAFNDEDASARSEDRRALFRAGVMDARATYEEAVTAVDWEPPMLVEQAISGAMKLYGLTEEGARYQLAVLRAQDKMYRDECQKRLDAQRALFSPEDVQKRDDA